MDGVEVRRFRYAPLRRQRLTNDGGIMANLKHGAWKWLLLPGFIFSLFVATWLEVRRWRPDVAHAHWLIPQGLAIALVAPLVSRSPSFMVTAHGGDLFALRAWPFGRIKRFVARRAGALTVVSNAMTDELKRLDVPVDRVSVQPMGVDLENRFTPDEHVSRSRFELLFVGRLVEKKGARYLLEALPRVLSDHPDAFLTIAGFGPDEGVLRQHAERLGIDDKVNFLGAQPQSCLPHLYRRAALFVAPFIQAEGGDQEGLGLVTVEAIGCGCPAIVTDIPATRDVIAQTEFRVKQRSPKALAESISTFFDMTPEDRRALADKQRRHVEGRFDWASRAASYARLLHRLASSA